MNAHTPENAILPTGRFVVLRHETPPGYPRPSHWDLMFETARGLRTWALDAEPDSPGAIVAQALADHRPEYLDYEGSVSDGRGHVQQWDAGTFQCDHDDATRIVIGLFGSRLRGRAVLECEPEEAQRWRFSFAADPD
jgi:DNA polymerase Ligase (LigD)